MVPSYTATVVPFCSAIDIKRWTTNRGQATEIVRLTQQAPPHEVTHWTLRAMAKVAGVAGSMVQAIWKGHGLSPHRWRHFKLSNDPAFAEKLTDIVGLYVDPPAHAVVLSVDEKSQIQALDRTELCPKVGDGAIRRRVWLS